ncbi:MAG: tyrosine-type recombinase/integrase [Nanoarchaeota archaeon]
MKKTLIKDLHQRFCDHSLTFKGNTPRTIKWLKEVYKSFIRTTEILYIEEVDISTLEEWVLKGKLERNWSPKTIRVNMRGLSLFLDWCVQKEYLKANEIKKIPQPKLPKRVPEHLTKENAQLLLEWTANYPFTYAFHKARALAIVSTFLFTGVRLSELINLKVNDVDIKNKVIFVRAGKGMKDRMIPMHGRLIEPLERYLRHRQRLKKTCPYFFTALRNDSKMGEKVIPRLFATLKKKSGIYFHPHMLRHTFAVLSLESGIDIYTLSKIMGHSDIKTTTIYLTATKSQMEKEIMKFNLEF